MKIGKAVWNRNSTVSILKGQTGIVFKNIGSEKLIFYPDIPILQDLEYIKNPGYYCDPLDFTLLENDK